MDTIFTPAIKEKADAILKNYETKRAAILEILRLLQEQYGYISLEMEQATAEYLEISEMNVHEVVTFYSLFYRKPKAKTRFQVCRTLSCSLLGAPELVKHLETKLGIKCGEKTEDEKFSVEVVECLGACELAPMMQLNDEDYVGHLTKEKLDELIKKSS